MLSFSYDIGPFGYLLLAIMAVPAIIVGYLFLTATRQARRDVLDIDHDEDRGTPKR